MILGIIAAHVAVNHDGLGGPLLADQHDRLLLLSDGLYEEVGAHVVHVGNQDGEVLGGVDAGVDVLVYHGAPVHPAT